MKMANPFRVSARIRRRRYWYRESAQTLKTVTVHASGGLAQHVRAFATPSAGVLRFRDWLEACGVPHVAMERTAVYWRLVFHIRGEARTCILANTTQIAQASGRKTDVNDAFSVTQLLEHPLNRHHGNRWLRTPTLERQGSRVFLELAG